MKTMKKYFKVILCFLAFAVCSFLLAFCPTITAVSAMEEAVDEYNMAINAIRMKKVVDAQQNQFKIPVPTTDDSKWGAGATLTQVIRVTDPAGYNHDYTIGGAENDTYFFGEITANAETGSDELHVKALNNGEYKVVYITKVTTGTGSSEVTKTYYSNPYSITVNNVSYELDFSRNNNLQNLYQTEVAVGSEIKVFGAIARTVGGTGSVELDMQNHVTVTKNGAIQNLNQAATANTEASVFKSRVIDDNGTPSDSTDDVLEYYIDANETGVYTIEYTYTESTNRPTKTFTINVKENFTKSEKLTVNSATLPSMELGQEGVTLPKLTVNNEYNKNVDHNVTKIVIEKETDSTVKHEITTANTYTFDFVLSNFSNVEDYEDMVGVYKVTYYIEDAYGVTTTYAIRTNTAITASTKPSVYLAYDYNTTAVDTEKETNGFKVEDGKTVTTKSADTSLKSNYGFTEIFLPAIYGTDKITNTEDLIFVRYLRNANTRTVYYIDNLRYEDGELVKVEYGETGYNYALNDIEYDTTGGEEDLIGEITNKNTTVTGDVSKAATFRFTEGGDDQEYAGTYYLEYKVISNKVKERTGNLYVEGTTTEYSITVLSDATNTKASTPTVEITNLKDSSINPDEKLTVKVQSSDEFDTRLKNAVFYFTNKDVVVGIDEEYEDVLRTTLVKDVEDTVASLASTIKNENILDSQAFKDAMVALGYEDFDVISETETKNNFAIESIDSTYTKITVAAITVNDNAKAAADTVELSLKYTDENDAPVAKVIDAGSLEGSTVDTVSDEKVFDQAEEVTLPTVFFDDFDNGVTKGDNNLKLDVMYYIDSPETDAGLDYLYPSNSSFYANTIEGGVIKTSATGTYYVIYSATDDAGNTSVMYFTFEVRDSSNPILSVNVVSDDKISQSGNTVTAEIGSTLDFETIVRSGDGKNTDYTDDSNITITIKANGLSCTPSGDAENSYIFNSVGTYTITVEASLKSDPTRKDTKVIYVEITKPNVVWLSEFDIPKYAAKGEVIHLPDMAASHDAVVTVKVTAPGGATPVKGDAKKVTLPNGITVWEFTTNATTKGTYTVTYTAVSKYATIEKTFSIKVGDNVAPVFHMEYENELKQDIVYTGSDISYKVEMNKASRKFAITVTKGEETIYAYTDDQINLTISDKDDSGYNNQNMSWSKLSYTVKGDKVTDNGSGSYTITGAGKVTLTLTIEDSYGNVATKEISFNVVTESEPEEVNNTVLGTVLIIISLLVLAGVIVFFIFTGNGKGGNKKVKAKKVKAEVSNDDEVVVEEKAEEVKEEKVEEEAEVKAEESETKTEESSDDEAKTGEVE